LPLRLIGRLVVHHAYQGIGLGTDLLADALRRCLSAAVGRDLSRLKLNGRMNPALHWQVAYRSRTPVQKKS
jgi:GNAT superfamily N-acetyltransferase